MLGTSGETDRVYEHKWRKACLGAWLCLVDLLHNVLCNPLPDTIGIVVERNRPEGETEHQQFYCPNCHALAWDEEFDCKDIVEHFSQSMEAFWADPERSTCTHCNTRIDKPAPVARIQTEPEVRIIREGE